MNWLENILIKEARSRRFQSNDRVRFFTEQRKGTGRNIVLTPNFQKGTILEYKPDTKRYVIQNDKGETFEVHPRNAMPETVNRPTQNYSEPIEVPIVQPETTEILI